jgi:hypothetical protein
MNMKKTLDVLFGLLIAATLLAFSGGFAVAGGLVPTTSEDFFYADFTNAEMINNQWWTLMEGNKFVYFAEEDDECAWNMVEVLGALPDGYFGGVYQNTHARIILDREWADEDCEAQTIEDIWEEDPDEVTYDWYAQDDAGNIWYMGEDTRDSDGSSEGSFAAGCGGAEAGIVMLGDPGKGVFYQQELLEDEAEDWGKALNFVELDGMECLKTKEWTPLEPGSVEHKFYCKNGSRGDLVLINELKGKTVVVNLIARDWDLTGTPPAGPGADPSPLPDCP